MKVPREAIILAGGLGKRMGNALSGPKWFTPIGRTTIANWQLQWLGSQCIQRVIVTLSRRYYTPHALPLSGPIIETIWEDEPIGDEGGLKKVLEHIEGEEALVCNCDVLTDLALDALPPSPTLVVVHPRSPWGVLREKTDFDGRGWSHQFTFFEEKPILPIWVSAGIYRFPKALRDELVDEGEIARNIVPKLFREGRLSILKYEGRWHAIETPKDIEDAKEFYENA